MRAQTGLQESYERCRLIHRERGRSYYLATALLPPAKRRHVHALYAFTRVADDLVDAPSDPDRDPAQLLDGWQASLHAALAGESPTNPLLPAVVDTIERYDLPTADFDTFLASMRMDLTTARYPTYADLLRYMEGSSAVIGTMMLPILGVTRGADRAKARDAARELGFGFQLTNFVRDVREDLDRGRIYLPAADLAQFGVTADTLAEDAARGVSSEPVRELVRYECQRALQHHGAALVGIPLLAPRSRLCIRAAFLLYGSILGEIEKRGYDVMPRRAVVPRVRRARLVAAALTRRQFAAEVKMWGR